MEYIDAVAEEKEKMKKELKKLLRKRNVKTSIIFLALFTVILAVAVFSAWNSGKKQMKQDKESEIAELTQRIKEQEKTIQGMLENPIIVEPVAPRIELNVIKSDIQEIGELATVEYLFSDAGVYSDSKQIKDLFGEDAKSNKFTEITLLGTEKKFTVKWNGVIKASVRVDLISVVHKEAEKELVITMPHAEILSYEIDDDSVEWSEDNNIFNPISIKDKVEFDKKTKEAMKKRAIENGLLEKAEKSAEKIIENLLQSYPAVDDSYTIVFVYE